MTAEWVKQHMKVIVTGIVAIMGIIATIVITSTVVRGELSSSTMSIITALFAPTLASLVALLTSENVESRVKRLEAEKSNSSDDTKRGKRK